MSGLSVIGWIFAIGGFPLVFIGGPRFLFWGSGAVAVTAWGIESFRDGRPRSAIVDGVLAMAMLGFVIEDVGRVLERRRALEREAAVIRGRLQAGLPPVEVEQGPPAAPQSIGRRA